MSRWQPPDDRPPATRDGAPDGRAPAPSPAAGPTPSAPLPPSVPVSPVRRVNRGHPGRGVPPSDWAPDPGPERPGGWPGGGRRFFQLVDEEQRFRQRVSRWAGILGLALVVGLLILAWSAVQLTHRPQAERVLQDALAPLTDIDRVLERDYAALVAEAGSGDAASVIVQSYPLGVAIPAAELVAMSSAQVRAHVLVASADRLYQSGVGVFEREGGGRGSVFSPRGVLELTAGQLTSRNHTIAIIAAIVLVLFLVPMVVLVLSNGSGPQRARGLGFAVLLGGAWLGLAVLIGRVVLRAIADSDDLFAQALLDIGTDVAWLPFRNALIFGAMGAIVLAGALGFEAWLTTRAPRPEPAEDAF